MRLCYPYYMARGKQIFRAECARPGHRVVVFYFRQRGLLAGMSISTLTLGECRPASASRTPFEEYLSPCAPAL